MNLEKLTKDIKDRETARFNYSGQVSIRENDSEPCFSGCMDLLTTAKVELGYNPKYAEESKDLEDIVKNPFESAFSSLTMHELNHKGGRNFNGCPRNLDLHAEKILEPMAETLSGLGFKDVPVTFNQSLYAYFANILEDIFVNSELGIKSDHCGMFLCYKDDAEHLDNKKFSPLFDAFVMLQERLYGGKRSGKLMAEHHSGDKKAVEAVDNFMKRSGLEDFKAKKSTKRKKQDIEVFDRRSAVSYCLDESNWPKLSKILAEEFSKLIDKTQLDQPGYTKKIFIPLKGESDSFNDEMRDPETKMKFAFKKYLQSGSAFEPPKYLDSFEALDLVYQRLARNLEIKTNASTRSETMPVMWYGKRPFEPDKDRLSKARIGMSREGELELNVKRYHEDDNIEYTESKQDLPEIRFVMLDTSGSMRNSAGSGNSGKIMNQWAKSNMQWNDNSKYHNALLGWYGLIEFLKKQGALKHTSVKFANYSDATYTAEELKDSKKLALSPQFGNTMLDLDKVKKMFGSNQLVFSISDGQVENWSSIKDEYIKRAKKNHYFHLQVGEPTTMSNDLHEAGLEVVYDDGRNLGKIIIDLTRPYVTKGKK